MGIVKICTEGSSSSTIYDLDSLDKSIVRLLTNTRDLVKLRYPSRIRTEVDRFLVDAQAKTDGTVNAEFAELDEYLSTIGVSDNTICN